MVVSRLFILNTDRAWFGKQFACQAAVRPNELITLRQFDLVAVVCAYNLREIQPSWFNQLMSNRFGRVGPIGLKRPQSTLVVRLDWPDWL